MDVQILSVTVTFFFTVIHTETKVRSHGGREVREENGKKEERGKGGEGEGKGRREEREETKRGGKREGTW